jgi:histidinol-phosphatase (PHP family)
MHLYEGKDPRAVSRDYFDLLARAAETGLFDTIGHPDLIKKFNLLPREGWDEDFAEVAPRIARSGAAVEVNTSGLRKPAGEIYPSPGILRAAARAGLAVTLGSDAHDPADVGAGFDRAAALLRSVG